MSGGAFDYQQYRLDDIANDIERIIKGDSYQTDEKFSPAVIEKMKEGLRIVRLARIYVQRIDWLVSCDDGEEDFLRLLSKEIAEETRSNQDS